MGNWRASGRLCSNPVLSSRSAGEDLVYPGQGGGKQFSGAIVKLSPWGTFALAAGASGKLSPGELMRLAGYVSSYTFAILLLTFVVLPGFVAVLTPYRMWTIVGKTRSAILTAFATSLSAVRVCPGVCRLISLKRDMFAMSGSTRFSVI